MALRLPEALRLNRLLRPARWYDSPGLRALPAGDLLVITDDPATGHTGGAAEVELSERFPRRTVGTLVVDWPGDDADAAAQRAAMDDLHERLRSWPDIVLLVDDAASPELKQRLYRQCLYYLEDGGAYVSVGHAAQEVIEEMHAIRQEPDFAPRREASMSKTGLVGVKDPDGPLVRERLAAATGSVRIEPDAVVVRKEGTHLLKLRESWMDWQLILSRGLDWAQEEVVEEGFRYPSPATVHVNVPRLRSRFANEMTIPDLKIRRYEQVVCQRREIVYRDDLLLPESFRLTGQRYLRHSTLQDVDEHFARPAKQPKPTPLPGTYYHLDTEFPNVYGHLPTDIVGRLWAWPRIKAAHPEVKVLISDRADRHDLPAWLLVTLEAFGIGEDDIQLLHRPRLVERLFGATPQFVNYENGYAHPRVRDTWSALRDALLPRATIEDTPQRMFVTRPEDNNRLCRNRDEVEGWFADHGFTIVRPETYSMPDQVALFVGATHLAGFGGSGMLTSIYATGPKKKLVINPRSHHPINEYLISTVYGDDITYLYQKPEVERPTPEFPRAPFHSPYTFDFAQGRDLLEAFAAD